MVGCRHDAKNTLDKNYLYLAEQLGTQVIPETEVLDIRELPEGRLRSRDPAGSPTWCSNAGAPIARAASCCRAACWAPCRCCSSASSAARCARLSDRLGSYVRTNSEALVGAKSRRPTSTIRAASPSPRAFIPRPKRTSRWSATAAGRTSCRCLTTVMVGGGGRWPRPLRWLGEIVRHPLKFLRRLQSVWLGPQDGHPAGDADLAEPHEPEARRRWYWPFRRRVDSVWDSPEKVPKFIPLANEMAERLAEKMDGDPVSGVGEVLFNVSSTAHILGGCPMGADAAEGVIDKYGRAFGYDNFYIADGSVVPVNLSVNPSLTICALSEWITSHIPPKPAADVTQASRCRMSTLTDRQANSHPHRAPRSLRQRAWPPPATV